MRAISCILAVAIALCARADAAAEATALYVQRIAFTWDRAPGADFNGRFTRLYSAVVSESGAIAIMAAANDRLGKGIWLRDIDGSFGPVLRERDPAPGFPAGVSVTNLVAAALNARGEMLIVNDLDAIWRREADGSVGLLVRTNLGQPPGMPSGSFFSSLLPLYYDRLSPLPIPFIAPLLNEAGQALFPAMVGGGGTGPLLDGNGLWMAQASGELLAIALDGAPVPGAAPGTLLRSPGPPLLNEAGEFAYFARAEEPGGSLREILVGPDADGAPSVRVAAGDPAPGAPTGARFTSFERVLAFDARGRIAFHAWHSANGDGLWIVDRAGGLTPIALRGDRAPGAGFLPTFYQFRGVPQLGEGGHLAFSAELHLAGGRLGARESAWRWDARSGLELLALGGEQAPGLPTGSALHDVEVLALNEWGDALLRTGSSVPGSGNADALVFAPKGAPPRLVVRTEAEFEVGPGERYTVTSFGVAAHRRGRLILDRAGNIPFTLHFREVASTGVFVARAWAANDLDEDGVRDLVDVCPLHADPGQSDADGDGQGDACNGAVDSDGDEFRDDLDVCPELADAQGDLDGDGIGDACDPYPDDANDEKASQRGELARTQELLGLALVALGGAQQELASAQDALEEVEGHLAQCLDRRVFVDADRDGEDDVEDACPGTPAGAEVDPGGCSLEQFCAGFAAIPAPCSNADWRNDEPLGSPRDCGPRAAECRPL
jgi:hypothetical protein